MKIFPSAFVEARFADFNAVLRSLLSVAASVFLLAACGGIASADNDEQPADGGASEIRWSTQQLDATFYSEGATAGDIDGDGHVDVVSGPYWYAGPDFKERFTLYPPKPFDPHNYSDNFVAYTDDINGNGHTDVLVIGFPGAAAFWYENPGPDAVRRTEAWEKHLVLDIVDNESPTYADLTGDGRRELVCSRDGYFGYAAPDRENPTAPWKFIPISDQSAGGRFTHGLGVGDVDGDGRPDLLEKSGWWQQPESLEGNPQWKKHPFTFSERGGAQMFAFDVDGDGLNDVVTSIEAHGYGVAWYRQIREGDRIGFERHMIVGSKPQESPFGVVFSQPHALAVADIDGDGLPDLVTGKRWWAHGPKGDAEPNAPAVVYWFQLQRRGDAEEGPPAVFVPHKIHDDSGVGTDVQAHDLTGNGRPDIVVGNKRGTFVHRQEVAPSSDDDQAARRQPFPRWDAAKPRPTEASGEATGLPPDEARAAMTVPRGFHVDLIAGEPDLHQPVAFTFDRKGRIWVAEAHNYPIRAEEGGGADRIVIFEDTDGDGTFDHRQVFIEGLNLVSGLEVGFGGVWVGAAPYLMFIPDADGDGVPDGPPVTLLDGWGYQDTHETFNSFTWGPDGWLYGCQGVFTHSLIGPPGTPEDRRTAMNAGVWRYHPTRHEFEVFAHGTSNPWGIDFDDSGQAFITTCVIAHAFHVIQGGRYQRQAGRHFDPYTFDDIKTIADHHHYAGNIRDHAWWGRDEAVHDDATSLAGGGHAHCGALVYLGDNWPSSYRNTLMMANIHGNRVNLDHLRRNGSGFIASHGDDVIFANDPWFRGINLRCGPDGAVYLIDWYDPNACHRTSPEIWDRSNGRLYRVRFGELTPRPADLDAADDEELIERHLAENDYWVRSARLVLQSRYAERRRVDEAIPVNRLDAAGERARESVRKRLWQAVTDSDLPADRRLRFLWTYHAIGGLDDGEVLSLLSDPEEDLRAWAMQLLTDRPAEAAAGHRQIDASVLQRLIELAGSERSPRVRLYLASLLQRIGLEDRRRLAAGLVDDADHASDANIPLMVWYGLAPLVPQDPGWAIELALKAKLPLVRTHIFRRAAVDPKLHEPLIARLAEDTTPEHGKEMLAELRRAAEQWGRIESPARWAEVVARWSSSDDKAVQEAVRFLSITFGDESIFPTLRAVAADRDRPIQARRDALAALAQGRDPELLELSLRLLEDSALRGTVIPLLARFDSQQVADKLLDAYPKLSDADRRAALDALISRPAAAHRLLEAIDQGSVAQSHLTAVHVSRMAQLDDESLVERLGEVWGTVRPTSDAIRRQVDRLAAELTPPMLASADRSEGRALYAKSCGQCHMLFGEGGKLGPDLTGADRSNIRYWLENIVDPNAVVGKDYQTLTALTLDGRVVTGLLREETEAAIVLEDAEKRVTLPRSDIDTLRPTSQSLMPEGLLQTYSLEQIASLIRYLQSPSQVPMPGELPRIDPESGSVPGVIEGESLEVIEVTGGQVRQQAMASFKDDAWSGDRQLWWTDGKPGDSLRLALPLRAAGRYEVFAVFTKALDYGTVTVKINDSEPLQPIDLYHRPGVITTGPISLGVHELVEGSNSLHLTLESANPEAVPRNMVGIDYVMPIPRTETETQ